MAATWFNVSRFVWIAAVSSSGANIKDFRRLWLWCLSQNGMQYLWPLPIFT